MSDAGRMRDGPGWVGGGLAYFAVVFAAGFVLGTMRVLVLAPRLGETLATSAELPVMLAISWWAAGVVVRRLGVPATSAARVGMGALAFALLLGAEWLLGTLAFGRTASEILAGYGSAAGAAGLAAQTVFAAIPELRRRLGA